jgi:2-desacetyl-2-hydroxyethyl bacteriochlorophyllide A dehydrogenase
MTTVVGARPEVTGWPSGTMRALQFAGPGELEIADVDVPQPAPGHLLVKVSHVGICGTDVHLLSGHSAYVVAGLTTYPIRFGHEWAGQVIAAADDVDPGLVGQTVVGEPFLSCGQCRTCRSGRYNLCPNRAEMGVRGAVPGAAAEYLRVPVSNVAVVPQGVLPEHALVAEPSVTVLNSYETAEVQPGERVAVLGTGAIGLIAVQLGVSMGCLVDAIGIDEAGLQAAVGYGARAALHPDDAADDGYDVVLDATGAAVIGPLLTRIAAVGGRIMEIGIPGRPVDGVDLAAFVSKGLTLKGVLGGVHLLPRALQLIAANSIRPDLLLESVVPVSQAATAFARCNAPGRDRPKIVLDMSTLAGAELEQDVDAHAHLHP